MCTAIGSCNLVVRWTGDVVFAGSRRSSSVWIFFLWIVGHKEHMLLLDSGRDSFQQASFEFLNVLGLIEVFLSLVIGVFFQLFWARDQMDFQMKLPEILFCFQGSQIRVLLIWSNKILSLFLSWFWNLCFFFLFLSKTENFKMLKFSSILVMIINFMHLILKSVDALCFSVSSILVFCQNMFFVD